MVEQALQIASLVLPLLVLAVVLAVLELAVNQVELVELAVAETLVWLEPLTLVAVVVVVTSPRTLLTVALV